MKRHPHRASFTRRQFHQTAALAAASLVAPNLRAGPAGDGYIDAHVHVWTPDVEHYPLAGGFSTSDMRPPSFTPEELLAHARPCGVDRIVLIQMSFYQYDNRYMLDTIHRYPGVFSGVGIVDHHRADLAERMRQLARRGVRGFRIHSRGKNAKAWDRDAGMAQLWKTAGQEQLAVCPLINPDDLPVIDALCRRFPETTVVIDHFARIGLSGRIERDRLEQLCALARYPATHVKVSAFYALGKKQPPYVDLAPMIRTVLDAFGPERLMWGSDCPYQVQGIHTYRDSIALIRDRLDFLSQSDRQWLLRKTAERVFFS